MAPVITATTTRSWANIVKGDTPSADKQHSVPASQANAPLQPGARGERKCLCQGELLVMLGHYGWIMALDEIDHPDAGQNGGRIYVHKRDVVHGSEPLSPGDRVTFYLYADHQGLGAEACELAEPEPASFSDDPDFGPCLAEAVLAKRKPRAAPQFSWHADASDVTSDDPHESGYGWNLWAAEFTPSPTPGFSMNAGATEFVPKDVGMNPAAAEFLPQAASMNRDAEDFVPGGAAANPRMISNSEVMAINLAYMSDDSDSEDETPEDPCALRLEETAAVQGWNAHGGDTPSEDGGAADSEDPLAANEWDADLDAVVLCAPLRCSTSASKRAPSLEGSTSASSCASDSEEEDRRLVTARPTPAAGLRPPPGFRPPPGLELPAPPGL